MKLTAFIYERGNHGLGTFYRCLRLGATKCTRHGELANLLLEQWSWLREYEPLQCFLEDASKMAACEPSIASVCIQHGSEILRKDVSNILPTPASLSTKDDETLVSYSSSTFPEHSPHPPVLVTG